MTVNPVRNIAEEVKSVIAEIRELPTLPLIAHKIIAYLNSPLSGAKEISELIKNDQALAARVLKLVNSAYFSLPKKVDDITRATVLLGFNNILQIVMNVSIMKAFGQGNEEFNRQNFWRHSIGVAVCAQHIATKVSGVDPGTAYTAGLLHDIGKIILDNYFHDAFMGSMTYAEVNKRPLYEVEQDMMGIDHSFVGNLLLMRWEIPMTLREAVKYHHYDLHLLDKLTIQNKPLVYIIRLANLFVASLEIGVSGFPEIPTIHQDDLRILGLSPSFFDDDRFNIEIEIEQHAAFLEVWE